MEFTFKVSQIISHQTAMRQGGKFNYPTKKGIKFKEEVNKQLRPLDIEADKPIKVNITFVFHFPKSYPLKKKEQLKGQYMTLKPDAENIAKLITDLVFRFDYEIEKKEGGKEKKKYKFDDKNIVELHIKKKWSLNVNADYDYICYDINNI